MPEIIIWWILGVIEKGAKYFWSGITLALLVLPFGIPILLAIALFKATRGKQDD